MMNSLKNKLFGENHDSPQNGDLSDDYICYASRPNSLIIRSNGDVGKCTVALYDERNKIATLQPDGTMKSNPWSFSSLGKRARNSRSRYISLSFDRLAT